jgi:glycosyltransferase involved in cell wall biosynthesis
LNKYAEQLKSGISVIIPAYNSAEILPELITSLQSTMEGFLDSYELILINDASPDNTWAVIEQLTNEYNWIYGVDLMRNYGQHNALLCGIHAAQYDVIITMDDDLQHPPHEIPKLLNKLAEGYDVVYGIPEHEQHGLWRDFASRITKIGLRIAMGVDIARNVSGGYCP